MSECRQPIVWVDSDAQLRALCDAWMHCPLLAVDTEFMRTDTYYPIPALVQISDGQVSYLIDPVAIADLSPLRAVMQSPAVQKVLHACSEDLEVFQVLLRCFPENLLDTQVAAAFCGLGFSVGYGRLVEEVLGVSLPKGETRSDWLARPLSESQRHYAAMDVEFLYALAQVLLPRMKALDREAWVQDDCRGLIDHYRQAQLPEQAAVRFKAAWRLNPRQLAALRILAAWRDDTARAANRVRSHVVRDRSLFAIAERLPNHISQLRPIEEMSDKTIRRHGDALIACLDSVRALPESELPAALPKPPGSQQQALITRLRDAVAALAESRQLAPECLLRRRDYECIARAWQAGARGADCLPPDLSDWRAALVQPVVQSVLCPE